MDADRDVDWLLPPDLGRLRVLEQWCVLLLELIRERIAEIEKGERVAEAARAGPVPAPVIEWKIQYGIGREGAPMLVHAGDCRLASGRTRPATREQVLDVLRNAGVEACGICATARELGLTDP
ncbi:DUF6233 domain-containing protein [Streptomyces sp. NPDC089799]|uniref:DUF6233 domain-containing protein n=1 Tax=Streptomyces sp. NPDC089799 TaxID=3155066 RepID=UPI003442CE1C